MDFEWDDDKFWTNLEKHGVSFQDAAQIFDGPIVTRSGKRQHGEQRWISIGMTDELFLVVVHTERDGVTRIISARLGGRRDRKYYNASFAQ